MFFPLDTTRNGMKTLESTCAQVLLLWRLLPA